MRNIAMAGGGVEALVMKSPSRARPASRHPPFWGGPPRLTGPPRARDSRPMAGTPGWLQRNVTAACDENLPVRDFAAEVAGAIGRAVPHDGYCLFAFDPASGGMATHVSHGGYIDRLRDCTRLWENELLE